MPAKQSPFVWLPSQAFDHSALFNQIHGSAQRRESEGQNRWILARGRFQLDEQDGSRRLHLTSDGRFRCWLNGRYLGGGPVRSHPAFLRSMQFDVGATVEAGENLLAVLIHLPGRDLAWYEAAKGGRQPVFGDGGLYAQLEHDGRTVPIEWRMIESDAWSRDAPPAGWGQNALELLDGNRLDPAWLLEGFDDARWERAQPMRADPAADAQARGWGPVEPFDQPIASATRPLAEHEVAPAELHWLRKVAPRPGLDAKQRLYNEELEDALDLPPLGADIEIATFTDSDRALMLSFDPYRVGRPFIEFTATGGEVIEMAVEEALPGEFGLGSEGDGFRPGGRLWVTHLTQYKARPGRQRFEWFHPTGTRALQIVVRDAPKGVRIHRVGLVACHHDTALEGEFSSGDGMLDNLWQRGRHTVLMCAQDGWLDCPGRESRQWLGDGIVMFDMAAYAIGPGIFPLHRQFLDQVAEGQRPDGLARMVAPGDIPASVTIPDYTLHWLIGVERYMLHSGDIASVKRWLPALEKALGWMRRHSDASGLIADVPEWHFIEWADLGREGWSLPFNALWAGALGALARVARRLDRQALAQRCEHELTVVTASLNRLHWDKQRGLYVDSVDPLTAQQRLRASQHGNALMLLFGLAPADRAARALAAITRRGALRLTDAPPIAMNDGPFDERINVVRANSFFAHFVYDAIAQAGGLEWVIDEIKALYGPMIEAGATTLWESFTPIASLCHGFSATPVYQMSRHMLGIAPLEPGYARFAVNDPGSGVPMASGAIPTPSGLIRIAWSADEAGRTATLEHPQNCIPVAGSSAGVLEQLDPTTTQVRYGH